MKIITLIVLALILSLHSLFAQTPKSNKHDAAKLQDLLETRSWEFEVPPEWGDQINITFSEYDSQGEWLNGRTIHVFFKKGDEVLNQGDRKVTIALLHREDKLRILAYLGDNLVSIMPHFSLPLEEEIVSTLEKNHPEKSTMVASESGRNLSSENQSHLSLKTVA